MSAVTLWIAIAAIAAAVVVATSIFASSRPAATNNRQSMRNVPPDPKEQERGRVEGGPDWARITQLVALAILIIAVIVLIFLWL